MIVLYGAEWCPGCQTQKRWLEQNDINFEYRDVDEPKWAKVLSEANIRSVPVLIRDGKMYTDLSLTEFVSLLRDEQR